MVYEEEVRRDGEQPYNQRRTDLIVIAAADQTGVKPYLMMPPTIMHSIDSGHPEYIGDGSGTVGYVHVADLAALYLLLLSKILDGTDIPYGQRGYYFSNTRDFTWRNLNEKIGEVGARLGVLESGLPTSVTLDEALNRWGFREGNRLLLETNPAGRSKTTPKHVLMLGWQPKKTANDWDRELEETWKAVLIEKYS